MAKYLYELDRMPHNYELQVARGRIEGASVFGAYGRIVTTGAYEGLLWSGTNFSFPPSTGTKLTVVSTSANDTAVTGTGARTIVISYLDTALIPRTEVVALAGLTPVLTVASDVRFVQEAFVITFGSVKATVGAITISSAAGNHVNISAGKIRSSSSVRTVPAGLKFMLSSLYSGSVSGTAAASTEITTGTTVYQGYDYTSSNILIPLTDATFQDNSGGITLHCPIPFAEGASIAVGVKTDKAATIVSSWRGWLEPA